MTDEEIIADAEARGVDVRAEAERVRRLMLDALRRGREARDRLMADPRKYRADTLDAASGPATWPPCAVCGKGAREGRHATDLGEGHDYEPVDAMIEKERGT